MNRVIKFRAWDKEENKMINNVVPFFNSDGTLECLVFGYSFGGYDFIEVELDKYQHIFTDPEFDKRYVLMQYTVLKDKNDVEIYEGDVLTSNVQPCKMVNPIKDGYGVVRFENGMFKLGAISLVTFISKMEVIGNIYENQELLEREVE